MLHYVLNIADLMSMFLFISVFVCCHSLYFILFHFEYILYIKIPAKPKSLLTTLSLITFLNKFGHQRN